MQPFKPIVIAGAIATMCSLTTNSASAEDPHVELTIINPSDLYDPTPNGYSHAVVAKGGNRLAYIAGQGGEDGTGSLSPLFANQVKQAYANLRTALEAVGAKPNQVTRITTYVANYDPTMLQVMQPLESYKGELNGAPRADEGADLDQLIDISVDTDQPVIITDKGQDVGIVTKPRLLRGIQGGKE